MTESVDYTIATVLAYACDANLEPVAGNREHADIDAGVGIKIFEAKKKTKYPRKTPPHSKLVILAAECIGRFSKDALEW